MMQALHWKIACNRLADQCLVDFRCETVYTFAAPPDIRAAYSHDLVHMAHVENFPKPICQHHERKECRHDAPVWHFLQKAFQLKFVAKQFSRVFILFPQIYP